MKDNFYKRLEHQFTGKVFSDLDLKILFVNKNLTQIHNSLSYYIKNKRLIKYKRGLYSLIHTPSTRFLISNHLYGPSYISFETALSHYNLIPEAVYETTAACLQKKKKIYKTSLGLFSFSHVPVRPFYVEVRKDTHQHYFIASPLRALFDYVYRERNITSE